MTDCISNAMEAVQLQRISGLTTSGMFCNIAPAFYGVGRRHLLALEVLGFPRRPSPPTTTLPPSTTNNYYFNNNSSTNSTSTTTNINTNGRHPVLGTASISLVLH